jgi:poly(3-hydroxybutyrate) depolymerase
MLLALLPEHDVYVTDWIDARDVPLSAGPFGFEDNIDYVIDFVRELGPGMHLIGLCQSVIPVLAAVALLAATDDPAQPASMTLIAGPVDPRRNPTRVDRLLAGRPITWFERATIAAIPDRYAGAGRRVYPALIQLAGLMMHLARHVGTGGELFQKLIADDGEDPERWPFRALYTAVMNLPAEFFIDQVKIVFKELALPRGRLLWRGTLVRPEAIRSTALITIEGEFDDIAAPGQTSAAHELCVAIPTGRRRRYVLAGIGHFGTFHGRTWRTRIMPLVRDAIHAF